MAARLPLPAAVEWVFFLTRPSGANVGALGAARTRRLSFLLDGPATVGFTMPGDHYETALIDDLATDLICGRNGVALFRGRIGADDDTLSADVHTSTFAAVCYRGMLGRRILWQGVRRSFRGADQADIAWAMIADSQALPGGDWGITRGNAPPTGVLRDRDYDPGKNLGEALDQLGRVIDPPTGTAPAFEWEVDAQRRFNLFYPRRGRQTGLVLTYGREITDLRRAINPNAYANAVRFNGADGTVARELELSAMPAEVGRWDAQRSDVNLILQSTVDERAASELETASTLEASFSVAMAAGLWDPNDLWVGDTARLIIRGGRLDVDVTRRIVGIDVELSDDGGEVVRLSVAAAEPVLTGRLQSYDSRIKNLERGGGYIPDVPVGGMFDWPGPTPPALTMWADGTWLPVAGYPELFDVIGYTYGGNGADAFALPNCLGRMTLAASSIHPAGSTGGTETVSLVGPETGVHTHGVSIVSGAAPHEHGVSIVSGAAPHQHGVSIVSGAAPHQHGGRTLNDLIVHAHSFDILQVQTGDTSWGIGVSGNVYFTQNQSVAHGHDFTSGVEIGGGHGHNVNGLSAVEEGGGHGHNVNGVAGVELGGGHGHNVNGTTTAAGASAPHENMPPWIAIGKVIKVISAQNQ